MNESGLSAAASLVCDLDKRLMVVLRDGRKYIGILRSFDQFSNIVLSDAVERIVVDRQYGDIPLGLYLVRGENVVLMGEVAEPEWRTVDNCERVAPDAIKRAQRAEREGAQLKGTMRARFDFLDD